jgi:hypothetical protein
MRRKERRKVNGKEMEGGKEMKRRRKEVRK